MIKMGRERAMNTKYILYLGLILLLAGVVFRFITPFMVAGLGLIISGVILKVVYIALAIAKGQYKPGTESLFLFVGLGLLFVGIWYKTNIEVTFGYVLVGLGLCLKALFVIFFVRKIKQEKEIITS
jgi:hypothetical protein